MYIDLICRQANRRKKGRSQKFIKFFKVKLITKLNFGLSSIQLYNEFGTILFSAGHALTIHDPFLLQFIVALPLYITILYLLHFPVQK